MVLHVARRRRTGRNAKSRAPVRYFKNAGQRLSLQKDGFCPSLKRPRLAVHGISGTRACHLYGLRCCRPLLGRLAVGPAARAMNPYQDEQ